MKKKEILQHCIDILYEQLIMNQIQKVYIEKYFVDKESSGYKKNIAEINGTIEFLMDKIAIAQGMLIGEKEFSIVKKGEDSDKKSS